MEKNIYALIQDWHELLKNGTITKDEFNSKKNELLNFEKIKNEPLEKEIDKIDYGKSKNFVYKSFYIFAGIVCAGILFFNIYERVKDNNGDNSVENASIVNDTILNAEDKMAEKSSVEESKTDNNILYLTEEEFNNLMPAGRKDFMEHNLEWIKDNYIKDIEYIKKDKTLSPKDRAEALKEIEDDYTRRINNVKSDGETRFK